MAKFNYLARKKSGEVTQGEIDAANETEVRVKLRALGLEPTRLTVRFTVAKPTIEKKGPTFFLKPRIKAKDLQIFTRQFSTLTNSGIPVVDALKILADGMGIGILKDALIEVRTSIESGRRLAESMAQHSNVFDKMYCNMIQAGEEAGILDGVLQRLAVYMEKNEKIKGQVKGALIMPMAIVFVSSLVITGIMVFIIPKFQEFFASSGRELPWITQMVVAVSQSLIHKWWMYLGVAIGVPYMLYQYIQTKEGKETLDNFMIMMPVFGDVVKKAAIARLTRILSTLLSSGIGVIEAIDIASKTAGNVVIEAALARCKDSVMQGRPFAAPLSREKVIPGMVVQMIAIGEQSGTLDVMLGKIADFYEEEVEVAVKAATTLIEPIMMVGLGAVIAIVIVAMYLPVFQMGDAFGG